MADRPILFSAPMVRALLAGRKTQTRRVVKFEHAAEVDAWDANGDGSWEMGVYAGEGAMAGMGRLCCPYGGAGDRLWVRETWAAESHWDGRAPSRIFQRLPGKHAAKVHYMADGPKPDSFGKTRVSIHMPKSAARIWLEVTRVRVQRVRDISEEDARAEGVTPVPFCKAGRPNGQEHVEAFEDLWCSINGAESWDANSWVWAIHFKRLETAR